MSSDIPSPDIDHRLNPQVLHPKSERRKFFEFENEQLKRDLAAMTQRCDELDSDLEIIRRNIAAGAVSVMWVQKFIEDRRADRAKQALNKEQT